MKRKQFTFYSSYYEAVKVLPKREQATVLLAICGYALNEEEPHLSGTADAIFSLIKPTLDASRRKSENGQKGGKQTGSKAEANRKQTASKSYGENKKEKEKEVENELEGENECSSPPCGGPPSPTPEPAAPAPVRRTHGANGRVKLSEEEYNALLADLGQAELDRCIAYVDEFAAMTGNKQKWKDWNLVLRKCHREQWGMTQQEKKNAAAKKTYKPTAREIEAVKRMLEGNA